MTEFSLPVSFHFRVSLSGPDGAIEDLVFQEVSGLESSNAFEPDTENNGPHSVHRLPERAKQSNLTLKRALSSMNSALVNWCKATLEGDLATKIETKALTIQLLDADNKAVAEWTLTHAYPIKWSIGRFDAMKNELAIETIALAYTAIKRTI